MMYVSGTLVTCVEIVGLLLEQLYIQKGRCVKSRLVCVASLLILSFCWQSNAWNNIAHSQVGHGAHWFVIFCLSGSESIKFDIGWLNKLNCLFGLPTV